MLCLKWPQHSPLPNSSRQPPNQIHTANPILYVSPIVPHTSINILSPQHTLAAASRPTSSIPGPFTAASFGPVLEQDLHPSSPGSSDVATYQPGR